MPSYAIKTRRYKATAVSAFKDKPSVTVVFRYPHKGINTIVVAFAMSELARVHGMAMIGGAYQLTVLQRLADTTTYSPAERLRRKAVRQKLKAAGIKGSRGETPKNIDEYLLNPKLIT
jgi:hypothetical protein